MTSLECIVLALTPLDRWSAARGGGGAGFLMERWFVLAASAVLVVLLALLLWIGYTRRTQQGRQTEEMFSDTAARRGLTARERQILLAVVMRSGLVRNQDIFTTAQAFERGVTRLLAECVRTRTTEENERLNAEVVYLREKLGFPLPWVPGAPIQSRRPSSRDIPEGRQVEATRRTARPPSSLHADVVRNDDIELVLELEGPVESRSGECWRVRYSFGMSVWEFDTLAVSCEGRRLVLNHNDQVRFINRRRFPRVEIDAMALVAAFPFMRRSAAQLGAEGERPASTPIEAPLAGPDFVEGRVTELAGPGLRIRTSLRSRPGERVLVIFRVSQIARPNGEIEGRDAQWRTIADIGQVKHSQGSGDEAWIAVELMGLTATGLDELVRLTNQAATWTRGRMHQDDHATPPHDESARVVSAAPPVMERA